MLFAAGTVPRHGLDVLAVGMERFEGAIDEELEKVAGGAATFRAVRGEYGSGKTFFVRWLAERARRRGFATSEVQISETETPLHRHETVYRRIVERLSTPEQDDGALRSVLDAWFYALDEDVLAEGGVSESNESALASRSNELLETRLGEVGRRAPAFGSRAAGISERARERTAGRGGRSALVARRSAPCRRPSQASSWNPRGHRPRRGARVPAGPAASCCATRVSPGLSSCSTRSRRFSACARTCASAR